MRARRAATVVTAALTLPLLTPMLVTTTPAASAQQSALPTGIDARNHQRTEWGTVAGHTVQVYVPRVVEEGHPIRLAVTGFTNLAGTAGARIGIKLDGGAVARLVPLDASETGGLTDVQRSTLWGVMTAAADGSAVVDVPFPATATASGLTGAVFGPGTVHRITLNSGSISPKGTDPVGSAESAPFRVVAPGTLEQELEGWSYTPTGQPDVFASGDPGAAPTVSGASAADGAASTLVVRLPGVAAGTWVHITPVSASGQASTATALSGQWVALGADGSATFRTGSLPTGGYRALVHTSIEAGRTPLLGAVAWAHTGPVTAITTPSTVSTTGGKFAGPVLSPWWTTAAATPGVSAGPTARSTITSTRAPVGAGSPAPAAPVVSAAALPTAVPVVARAAAAAGRSTPAASAAPVVAPAAGATSALSQGAATPAGGLTDSARLLSADTTAPGALDADVVLMAVAAALLLIAGMCASTLVAVGRTLARAGTRPGPSVPGSDAPTPHSPTTQETW